MFVYALATRTRSNGPIVLPRDHGAWSWRARSDMNCHLFGSRGYINVWNRFGRICLVLLGSKHWGACGLLNPTRVCKTLNHLLFYINCVSYLCMRSQPVRQCLQSSKSFILILHYLCFKFLYTLKTCTHFAGSMVLEESMVLSNDGLASCLEVRLSLVLWVLGRQTRQ